MNTKAIIGLALTVPVVLKSWADFMGYPIPALDEVARLAITIAGTLGVPVLLAADSVKKKR